MYNHVIYFSISIYIYPIKYMILCIYIYILQLYIHIKWPQRRVFRLDLRGLLEPTVAGLHIAWIRDDQGAEMG